MKTRLLSSVSLCLSALILSPLASAQPPSTRVDTVFDTLHGVVIADPYRWLEDGKDAEVLNWLDRQEEYFRRFVDSFDGRSAIREAIAPLYRTRSITSPIMAGNLYIWQERLRDQNQEVYYGLRADGEKYVLIDPNGFSEDGTVSVDWLYPSADGSLLAYGVSASGSELSTLRIRRTDDLSELPDTIPYTRAASVAWLPDNSGFYYTRFPTPGEVAEGDENYFRRVYFHEIGGDWRNDPLVFGEELPREAWTNAQISPDGTKLICSASLGYVRTDYYIRDLAGPQESFVKITPDANALYQVVPLNDRFFILTNLDSPRQRVLLGRYEMPEHRHWSEIIPESDRTLQGITVVAGLLAVQYEQNAFARVAQYDLNGGFIGELPVSGIGTTDLPTGKWDGEEWFYAFESYDHPTAVFHDGLEIDSAETWDRVEVDLDLTQIEVQQVWYESKDGTRVSMFLIGPRGMRADSALPTILYGYGGFNVSMRPSFSKTVAYWASLGGLYAIANLRGGGEYGEEWHRAGMLENRQNVFDDFIAAADFLVAEGYTTRDQLAIKGGSNGGLLVGAVAMQRPDLCRAVVCQVPLLDMVRYHKFGIARLWISEYGSSEDPDQFEYILSWSPYHNIEAETSYPATYFTTAEADSRVDPLHACKMVAALQEATSSNDPILLRFERKAGHGRGKPVSKSIEAGVDESVFLCRMLGVDPR